MPVFIHTRIGGKVVRKGRQGPTSVLGSPASSSRRGPRALQPRVTAKEGLVFILPHYSGLTDRGKVERKSDLEVVGKQRARGTAKDSLS